MSGREKNAHFRAHYLFWPNFLDQNSENQENYKNSAFSENCPKPKMTPFFKMVFFDIGERVFEKLCSSENTIFIVCFQQSTAIAINKRYVAKTNYEKIVSCFEHGKMVFWGVVF